MSFVFILDLIKNGNFDKGDYSKYIANYVRHKHNTKQSANKIKNSSKGLLLVEYVLLGQEIMSLTNCPVLVEENDLFRVIS